MNLGYTVRPRADRDIDELADFLAEQAGLDTGLRFLNELYATLALLASQPEMGWRANLHSLRLVNVRTFRVSGRFRHILIFYRHEPLAGIEILRVIHGSRELPLLLDD